MVRFILLFIVFGVFVSQVFAAPMTLSSCIDYGLQHSRELRIKQVALENQELSTLIKRAEFAFQLSAESSQDDDDNLASSFSIKKKVVGGIDLSSTYKVKDYDADTESNTESISVRISKVILGGGSIKESRLGINNSLIDEIVRLNELNKYRRELKFRIKRSYYSLIRNNQTLKIWDMRLARSKTNLEHALEREDPLDIATARIEIPENEASLLSAKRQIESSLDSLKELIGMDVIAKIEVDQGFKYKELTRNLTNDIAFCFANHEDVLNVRLDRKKLENSRSVARSRVWPKLSVWGSAVRLLSDTEAEAADDDMDDEDDFSAGLSLYWEFGSPTTRAVHKKLSNDLTVKGLNIRTTEQGKVKEVRDLARRLDEATRLVQIKEQKMALTKRRVELYADRWKNGEIDILEYIRSQNDLENTRISLINQKTTYMELVGEYMFNIGK
ncbi:MAG: TolC family protein [Kiritimatiellae bacterium]|nr:TolC family protein [Kiritimatiellia bacterium]